ncbi:MAG: hypothetical protein SFX74_03450 [Fimbriimonadaceae bacterium]|nr:hypothetical protein [Fimbriimonadaceae bacterium]
MAADSRPSFGWRQWLVVTLSFAGGYGVCHKVNEHVILSERKANVLVMTVAKARQEKWKQATLVERLKDAGLKFRYQDEREIQLTIDAGILSLFGGYWGVSTTQDSEGRITDAIVYSRATKGFSE